MGGAVFCLYRPLSHDRKCGLLYERLVHARVLLVVIVIMAVTVAMIMIVVVLVPTVVAVVIVIPFMVVLDAAM
jgi:hypothetical protein